MILRNTSLETRSITLQWQRPATLCDIASYFISYNGAVLWGNNSSDAGTIPVVSDNNTVTYVLNGLVPYSNYSVQVWAENLAGNGTYVSLGGLKTQEDG